jgi:hypothetical protein
MMRVRKDNEHFIKRSMLGDGDMFLEVQNKRIALAMAKQQS